MERLRHPVGVALDREGRLVVVEAGRGRVLRLETGGEAMFVASGMRHPQWVAAAPDGHLYVTATSLASKGEEGEEEPEMVVRFSPGAIAKVFADRFRGLQGVAVSEDTLQVVARGRNGERHPAGTLYEIPIQPDGQPGRVQPFAAGGVAGPVGLAADRLGASFLSAGSLAQQPWLGHVIAKVGRDGSATLFAAGLDDPRGLAFGPDGSLYLADGNSGRILRFAAPLIPLLDEAPSAITSQPVIRLRLRAEPAARLTVLGGRFPLVATVDDAGSATVSVSLRRNDENHLLVFATGTAGLGLTSAPLLLSIIQDEEPPTLELQAPQAGALLRGTIAAEARAIDLNGIADVEFRLDELTVGFDAAPPFRVSLDTGVASDGLRIVSAIARDRAGNVVRARVPVTVDNTPPEVRIIAPAPGPVAGGVIEVVVEAADTTSGVAQVELTVNGTSRSVAETPPYQFKLDTKELGLGPQVLQAAAVDRAGNRGESPPVSIVPSSTTVEIQEGDLVTAPSSGVAPLTVLFSLPRASGGIIALDADGDGFVDFIGPRLDGQAFTFTRPGLYFPSARVTDAQGKQSTVTAVVNVEDPQTVTTRFQGLWTSLKTRLGAGDVTGALAHLVPNLQPRFQAVFQQLQTDLPAIAAGLGDLEVLEQVGDLAETAMVQQENGAPFLYFIYFRRDSLGRWLIEEM